MSMDIKEGNAAEVILLDIPEGVNASTLGQIVSNPTVEKISKKRAAPAEYYIGVWNLIEPRWFRTSRGPFRTKIELQKCIDTLPEGEYEILHGNTKKISVRTKRQIIFN